MRHISALLVVVAFVGCVETPPDETTSSTSALSTQYSNELRLNNVALNGIASSSGAYSRQLASTINDGQRGSLTSDYWESSSTATVYNCNYGNWWVSVDFTAPPGGICPIDPTTHKQVCAHNISEIDLFSLQDYRPSGDPTTNTLTTLYGNVDFHLYYCPSGTTCLANGTGWAQPPGGYVTANNHAWTKISFAPVSATSVRASIDCTQSQRAYVTELEAWEPQAAPSTCASDASIIPNDGLTYYVGSDNSAASIVADSDRFWWRYYGSFLDGNTGCSAGLPNGTPGVPDGFPDDIDNINCWLSHNGDINVWWYFSSRANALITMYDLLAPVDMSRAKIYLERLRKMSNAFLTWRDDKRWYAPFDVAHHRVMPAWGSINTDYNGQAVWVDEVSGAAEFNYPMAAFARRVAANPDLFCTQWRDDAIKFTNAVLETYIAFRGDMQMSDTTNPAWGYYTDFNHVAWPYNITLLGVRPLVEIASAADSDLYKTSAQFNSVNYFYATDEAPQLIAKTARFFTDNLQSGPTYEANGLPWYWWSYAHSAAAGSSNPENLSHGGLSLSSLLQIWENRTVLDGLLARAGHSERISTVLTSTLFTKIATTFTNRIWFNDATPGSPNTNLLTDRVDGPYSHVYPSSDQPWPTYTSNGNNNAGAFVGLAQFNSAVWTKARDASFQPWLKPNDDCVIGGEAQGGGNNCKWPALSESDHSALLRYRAYAAP